MISVSPFPLDSEFLRTVLHIANVCFFCTVDSFIFLYIKKSLFPYLKVTFFAYLIELPFYNSLLAAAF